MYYLLSIKATLFTNFCATVIVGTWVVLPEECNNGSNNMFLNLSREETLNTTTNILLYLANLIGAHLKPRTQQLGNIFCKTHHERKNTIKKNSRSSPTDARPFIFPLLKPHTQNYQIRIYANKKDSSIASNCHSSRLFP